MDREPSRPSRVRSGLADNLPPAATGAQQYHPLMSNMSSNNHLRGNAAVQGAVKRDALSAFATNTQASAELGAIAKNIQNSHSFAAMGQENNPTAKAFQVPPQRPKSVHVQNALPSFQSGMNLDGNHAIVKPAVAKKATIVFNDHDAKPAAAMKPAVGHFVHVDRKSPRHHKSQPHLKADQAPLRRTKSRVLPKMDQSGDVIVLDEEKIDVAGGAAWSKGLAEKMGGDVGKPFVEASRVIKKENVPLPSLSTMPAIVSQATVASQPANASQSAVMPQSTMASQASVTNTMADNEENWDDDEEFYDDQAYVTANSFRSFGDNTTGGVTLSIVPKMNAKIQRELANAKIVTEANLVPEEQDDEAWDVSMVAEYGDEIFEYLRHMERHLSPDPHYMDTQTELQWSMRAVLIDWVVQVHHRFNLLPETLFLTINYIDRFLTNKVVSVGKLQLVGATAIFIASKYEEINCPSISEIVYMVDGGYTADEILKAERFMLSMLSFELGWPGPMSFLRRISKADDYDLEIRTLAKYFLELTIMDERFVATPPSFTAAGAHYLARAMLKKNDWTEQHVHFSGYTLGQLKPLVVTMLQCASMPRHHNAIYEKYTHPRFKEASFYVDRQIKQGFNLPWTQRIDQPRQMSIPNIMDEPIPMLGYDIAHPIPISG